MIFNARIWNVAHCFEFKTTVFHQRTFSGGLTPNPHTPNGYAEPGLG
jgi:hypothetical protein